MSETVVVVVPDADILASTVAARLVIKIIDAQAERAEIPEIREGAWSVWSKKWSKERGGGMSEYMTGKVVSEAEAAAGLGFADVFEFRRWQTEMGQKVADVEEKLRAAANDRDSFRWHGKRMQVVLEKVAALPSIPDDIALAISVVLGKGVDWEHRLDGWFDTVKP